MIGHRDRRHGVWLGAARLDDGLNLPASSTAGTALAAGIIRPRPSPPRGRPEAAWRDAGGHLSPNAGWPEAAVAGALAQPWRPRSYAGRSVDLARMGDGQAPTGAPDIMRALALYRATLNLTTCLSPAPALLWPLGPRIFHRTHSDLDADRGVNRFKLYAGSSLIPPFNARGSSHVDVTPVVLAADLRGVTLPNRIVLSPLCMYPARRRRQRLAFRPSQHLRARLPHFR